jgi:predicted small secreted protein
MWKMKAEKWALFGVGIFVVLMICAGIVGYHEQKEGQEQVNVVKDTFEEIEIIGSYSSNGVLHMWKIHDNKDNVTCWVGEGGMSCIPDHLLSP